MMVPRRHRGRTAGFLIVLALVSREAPAAPDPASDRARAVQLLRDGYYAAAESTARLVLASSRPAPGDDSIAYARAIDVLVPVLARNGKAKRAETHGLAETAVRIKERTRLADKERAQPPNDVDLAVSLHNLGEVRFYGLSPASSAIARVCFRRALALRTASLGDEDTLTVATLSWLARTVADSNLAAAQPMFEQALAIRERLLPADHRDVANSLHSLGWIQRMRGDYHRSQASLERALAIRERILQPLHPDLASTLQQYGWLTNLMGDTPKAIELDRRALAIREAALPPRHVDTGHVLNDIGFFYTVQGQSREARDCLTRALAIFDEYMGVGADQPNRTRGNLARLYFHMGDYAAARPLFEQAIEGTEKVRGRDHAEVAPLLASLAQLLEYEGDDAGARPLLERSVRLSEAGGPGERTRLRSGRFMLASLLGEMGEWDRADSMYAHALGTPATAGDSMFSNRAPALANWGLIRYQRGDYGAADTLGRRAVALTDTMDAGGLGESLAQLAAVAEARGDTAEAARLYERAEGLIRKGDGPDHPSFGYALASHAEFLTRAHRPHEALERALGAERIGREHVVLTMSTLSERQALGYAARRASGLDALLTLACGDLDAKDRAAVSDAVMRARALVLDEVASRHRRVADIGTRARRFSEASERLAMLTVRGGGDDPAGYPEALERARTDKETAERELSESSATFRATEAGRRQGFADVAAALPDQSALVAYVVFHRIEPRHSEPGREPPRGMLPDELFPRRDAYAAIVQRAGELAPDVVDLGDRSLVDSLVARWSEEASRGARMPARWVQEGRYRIAGEALRRIVWDPVAARLGGAERVHVVPDGALQLVNLATLPTDSTHYLVESGPVLHTLNAERDLLLGPSRNAGRGLLALGGPEFDHAPTRDAASSARATEPIAAAFRGGLSHCSEFTAEHWAPLPGAAAEARNICTVWTETEGSKDRSSGSGDALLLVGGRANEASFKRLAAGRRVLHLATHGFFLNGTCDAIPTGSGPAASTGIRRAQAAENPLLLSGFALAGANLRAHVSPAEDDGVLTAEEISAMDLAGVDWAVLSACETGVGEVRSGEGVFGLRRAFQIAGARTLVMSLWSVEDESARTWMEALYRARLERNRSTADAVRDASTEVLRDRRSHGLSTHPFYWGAFVAAGDWR